EEARHQLGLSTAPTAGSAPGPSSGRSPVTLVTKTAPGWSRAIHTRLRGRARLPIIDHSTAKTMVIDGLHESAEARQPGRSVLKLAPLPSCRAGSHGADGPAQPSLSEWIQLFDGCHHHK